MLKKPSLIAACKLPFLTLLALTPVSAHAQTADVAAQAPQEETTSSEPEDEVISFSTRIMGQHDGMDAFFKGDFETAEIEFEQEFKRLKRFESAKENAALDAALGIDRAADVGLAGNAAASSITGPGGSFDAGSAASLSSNSNVTSNFVRKRAEGRTILTDGKVTYEDFGFSRYMSALSEIKLAKYDEAYKSLKTSLRYTPDNYDARFRLGLLELQKRDFEGAADQLERLSKMRQKCIRLECDDLDGITEAAVALSKQITGVIQAG
ncbi:MAG: tetratricopeptide repeat protein [Pseudomonadota bacterium]